MDKYPYMFSRQQFYTKDISRKALKNRLYTLIGILAGILTLYFFVSPKLPNVLVAEMLGGVVVFNIILLIWEHRHGFMRMVRTAGFH